MTSFLARPLGCILTGKIGKKYALAGKGWLLAGFLAFDGLGLMLFSSAGSVAFAMIMMLTLALSLKAASGVIYAMTPFLNTNNVGLVTGIVGAVGNVRGIVMGYLLKSSNISYAQAFYYIGVAVVIVSFK